MSTAHTPGPWFVPVRTGTQYVEARIGGGWLQEVAACGPTAEAGQQKANARLIAAAPDLLEACVAMIEWDDREQDHAVSFNQRTELCRKAFDKARAAIAKATEAA